MRPSEPPKKKLRLSLSRCNRTPGPLQDATNRSRFAKPVDSVTLQEAEKGVVLAKTEASTQWALRTFSCWASSRSSSSSEIVAPDLPRSHDAELVCKWLCCFVLEARKTDSSRYPPATLRSLVSGLNRQLQRNKAPFFVLDKGQWRIQGGCSVARAPPSADV